MDFRIVLLRPRDYVHSQAFAEVAQTLVLAFRALGCRAEGAVNQFVEGGPVNVVLGGHLLGQDLVTRLPAKTVFYNLEQVEEGLFDLYPVLREIFRRYEVWDYSRRNIERLSPWASRVYHLPIGTMPRMTRIVPADRQDIDVLFYGATNPRRDAVLDAIAGSGLNLHASFGVYGEERDHLIARAKVVLNMHQHAAQIFEVVRVSYLLANRKAVVSELSTATAMEDDLADGILGVPYDQLAAACRRLVEDGELRHRLEIRGYETMAARRQDAYLRTLLAERG